MVYLSQRNRTKLLNNLKKIEKIISSEDVISAQDLFLDKVIWLVELSKESYKWKKNEIDGEYGLKVLKRYENMYFWETDFKDVDDLLNMFLDALEQKLDKEIIKLKFSILPALCLTNMKAWSWEFVEGKESVDKYRQFLNILLLININIEDLLIYEEKIDKDIMRQYPYKIIYISEWNIDKTVLISDEIWQATFVYDWIIRIEKFENYEKWEQIEWLVAKQIPYSEKYLENLKEAILTENQDSLKADFKISAHKNVEWVVSLKDILKWQEFLESKKELLENDANIFFEDWKWYFWDAYWAHKWSALRNFPNAWFNKDNDIWDQRWSIRNSRDLKILFYKLWINVATEQEETDRWWRNLEKHEQKLADEANIYKEEEIWYFWDAKGIDSWVFLQYYPNTEFNKKHNICNASWSISNSRKLSKMFDKLWLKVATSKQEKVRWWKIIEAKEKELAEEANIYRIKGIWYFWDAKGSNTWTELPSFPNVRTLKEWKIWSTKWAISNPNDLKKMFKKLGLQVATPKQEKVRWWKIIEWMREKLEKEANIYNRKWIWYFAYARWARFWSELVSYPNTEFNRDNKIWNEQGTITNPIELKKMFEILWLKVASDEKEIIGLWLLLASYKDRLANESNIYEKNRIWYFWEAKWNSTWSSYLQNFPGWKFNRENGLWDHKWAIVSLVELQRVFNFLGLKVSPEKIPKKN